MSEIRLKTGLELQLDECVDFIAEVGHKLTVLLEGDMGNDQGLDSNGNQCDCSFCRNSNGGSDEVDANGKDDDATKIQS